MKKLLFKGPVTTASGYGVHARQLLLAFLRSGKYDVSVQGVRWGETSFVYPNEDPYIAEIYGLIQKYETESRAGVQYDVSVQVTIPNEFSKLAPVNIGITAGIEVDRVSPQWILKANDEVDLVIVPSMHSANTFASVQYQDEKGNIIKLQKPMAIVPEGVDTRFYNTEPVDDLPGLTLDTEFNFLTVGLGLDKSFGEDRKNITSLVKWFCEKFKDDKSVGLVMKVGLVGTSYLDNELITRRLNEIKRIVGCGEFPRIYLVHGRLSDGQMAQLYKHSGIKAYVTLTHGEGYGLPIIEAAACGLPVLAPAWSGHVDFLCIDGKKKFVAIDHDIGPIPESAVWPGVIEKGTNWAHVREDDTKSKMKKVILSYDKPKEWADELAKHIGENYSIERVSSYLIETVERFLAQAVESRPHTQEDAVAFLKSQLGILPGQKTLLYTMPMSAGDVYISTAVVDSLRKKHPGYRVFFATDPKYGDILRDNPNIDDVLGYDNWMQDVPFCEKVFDEVYTPNLAIQTLQANWVRGGRGRLLGDEMAAQCQVELGEYLIGLVDPGVPLPEKFIVVHPGSGQGQWEARNYNHWQDVISNLVSLSGLPVVQVGMQDDPQYDGATDLRGMTPDYRNLAYVISKAQALVGIDSVSMHMAAGLGVPHVALFGSSYSTSTGPAKPRGLSILMETPSRYSCEKACYKYQCSVDRGNPCVNEIAPKLVFRNVLNALGLSAIEIDDLTMKYKEHVPTISGYIHVLDAETHGYPYIESIRSMLGFCDEVVVVDGGSKDGTVEKIIAIGDERVKMFGREWDWAEPGMDGMQKAYGRAMCTGQFLWQQDADEVVHEDDYEKVRKLAKRFPRNVDLVHLPVVEMWGDPRVVRTDRHSWKWRMSRNNFRITHGINRDARVMDEKTGRTYAMKGRSDGCEFIDIMTGEFIPHGGFYNKELEILRQTNPQAWGARMNDLFDELPCVFHYSWVGLERKIRHFKSTWNRLWSNLYNDPKPEDRFPDVTDDPESVTKKALELKERGGEHGSAQTFELRRSNPAVMEGWSSRV